MDSTLTILVAAPKSRDSITLISQVEEDLGVRAELASTLAELRDNLQQCKPDIIVVETEGSNKEFNLSLIRELRRNLPEAVILPMIPASRREILANLIKIDISFYIHTPIERAETTIIFNRAAQHISLRPRRTEFNRNRKTRKRHIDWSSGIVNFNELINELETELIIQALSRSQGNKKEAARLLNLKRTTLLEKIKKKDITSTTK